MYIPSKEDLKLVPVHDLIDEVKSRHKRGIILAYMVDDPSYHDREWELELGGEFAHVNLLKEYINLACGTEIESVFFQSNDVTDENIDDIDDIDDIDED